MLELRPNCECCDKDLLPNATDAMICSFECTFCIDCVENKLFNVCPNCGGGFTPRPIRPGSNLKDGNFLGNFPASTQRVVHPIDLEQHAEFAETIKRISSEDR